MKHLIDQLSDHVNLYIDPDTGIAWVEDGSTGCGHSAHPNIDATGSVAGMKNQGFWYEDARCVESHGYIYNVDAVYISSEYDRVAGDACSCIACWPRRINLSKIESQWVTEWPTELGAYWFYGWTGRTHRSGGELVDPKLSYVIATMGAVKLFCQTGGVFVYEREVKGKWKPVEKFGLPDVSDLL